MAAEIKASEATRVLEGNEAAAYGAMLCQPDVICAYPITPQNSLLTHLFQFKADDILKAEMVAIESEHSAMSALIGAAKAGGRTFSSTSSQGLAFMYEPYFDASTMRLSIVMVIATREMQSPIGVACSEQDAILARDGGWIMINVESCQEILDGIIMAYRLAEDPEILLPVNVCYNGFYLSYLSEAVNLPTQEEVQRFLPPFRPKARLDPQMPMTNPQCIGELAVAHRYGHIAAMQRTKTKLDQIDQEFQNTFGRSYGGQIEEYRCEDAEIVLIAMGSCVGTAKVVVDKKRDGGMKVGLIKIRMFRPFPRERIVGALRGKKAVGLIDRNVCFGWDSGTLFIELKAALFDCDNRMPALNFIAGLSGLDITFQHIERVIDAIQLAAHGKPYQEVIWLDLE
jgi:pyruvate ferredoxin oxidoreductase alpha subunit/phenylglyoxylate dehydrogenase alpha subunit